MRKVINTLFVLWVCSVSGQIDFKKLIPPNPNVAAVMKPVLTPVTEYAGIPNLGIPICNIQEDGMNIPISINYHSGGILVSEEASQVGLGWSLNAGGTIYRTVNGFPDFGEDGTATFAKYLQTDQLIPDHSEYESNNESFFSPSHNSYKRSDEDCQLPVDDVLTYFPPYYDVQDSQDYLPDTFSFNFNGYSGSFILKPNGEIFQTEKNGLIIEYEPTSGNLSHNYNFKFITEDGTQYLFEDWAKTNTNIYQSSVYYTSSWFLSKIVTVNGREIVFNYDQVGENNGSIASSGLGNIYPFKTFLQYLTVPGRHFENFTGPQTAVQDVYLTSIDFTDGRVDFMYSEEGNRQDVPTAHYLERIEIHNNTKLVKYFDFDYSYFGSESALPGTLTTGTYSPEIFYDTASNPSLNLRLKLDTIIENGIKKHSFDYYTSNIVPNKTTLSQDYWGFYNGILNTKTLIPSSLLSDSYGVSDLADRHPVASSAKLFSLKRIQYPTGGFTEFDYESNTYDRTAIDYNFWSSSFLPFPDDNQPPNTVQKSEFALSSGNDSWIIKEINPQTTSAVSLRFDLYISSTLELEESGTNPFNFGTDMEIYVKSKRDGTSVWRAGFMPSEQALYDFNSKGEASYSVTIDRVLNDPEGYTLEVYFNNYDGLYFGQAKVTATWEELDDNGISVGGGLRIKSIVDYEADSRQSQKRSFNYHYEEMINGVLVEKSYGKLKTSPNFTTNYPVVNHIPVYSGSELITYVTNYRKNIGSSSSTNPLAKDQGSYVGYSQVEMTYENTTGHNNGKTVSKYYNFLDYLATGNNLGLEFTHNFHKFSPIRIPHNGRAYEVSKFKRMQDNTYAMVSQTTNEYTVNGISAANFDFKDFINTSDYVMSGKREWVEWYDINFVRIQEGDLTSFSSCLNSLFHFRPVYTTRVELAQTQNLIYDESSSNPQITIQRMFYDNDIHYMPTRTETIDSKGNMVTIRTWYPDDIFDSTIIDGGAFQDYTPITVFKKNGSHPRIGQAIQTLSTNNGNNILNRTNFSNWGNKIYQPISQQSLKGELTSDNNFQNRIFAYDYDTFGNPLEFSQDNGAITSYIWGYNKKYLIAKIENASYQDIANALQVNVETIKSYTENDLSIIATLRTNLKTAMVTTYKYDPLIGVTNITDPRGYTMEYNYDSLNRLIEIKDDQNNIISDYKYNYKGQNN